MEKKTLTAAEAEQIKALEKDLGAILNDPVIPVPGCGVMAFKDGQLLCQLCKGFRTFDESGKVGVKPFTADTRFRTASISKVYTALAVMRFVERGALALDEDISVYLGFPLRNPNYPDRKITLRMLLSHTSSLRDGSVYSIAPEFNIEQFFLPDGAFYANGEHYASGRDGVDRAPGHYFAYTNLNYGLIGTILERISGKRFDELMTETVLAPMGIGASFNVGDFDAESLDLLTPLYRSQRGEKWDASEPWHAEIDDYNGVLQPRDQVLITNPDLQGVNVMADLKSYHIGDNGTLFSPQGGLRISMNEHLKLAELFLNDGAVDGRQIITKESLDTMFAPYWTYAPDEKNGDTYDGLMACYGPGIQTMTSGVRDRFLKDRKVVLSGHFGEAYGLLAGLFVNRQTKTGIFYVMNGQGAPDSAHHGRYSGMYEWEERFCTALLDDLFPALND